jgi:hypothetical protein
MAQSWPTPVYVVDPPDLTGILGVPAIFPFGYVGYRMWLFLDQLHWHLLFKILGAVFAAMGLLVLSVMIVIMVLPRFLAALIAAAYMAVCYGGVSLLWLKLDEVWSGAIAVVAAAVGWVFLWREHKKFWDTYSAASRKIGKGQT